MTYYFAGLHPVRSWHSSINSQSTNVTSFNWFIAACILTAIQYGYFQGESVGVWSFTLMFFCFSIRLYLLGGTGKSSILNHEF